MERAVRTQPHKDRETERGREGERERGSGSGRGRGTETRLRVASGGAPVSVRRWESEGPQHTRLETRMVPVALVLPGGGSTCSPDPPLTLPTPGPTSQHLSSSTASLSSLTLGAGSNLDELEGEDEDGAGLDVLPDLRRSRASMSLGRFCTCFCVGVRTHAPSCPRTPAPMGGRFPTHHPATRIRSVCVRAPHIRRTGERSAKRGGERRGERGRG
eukprot:1165621-Rhodomonas_salina.1